MSPFASSTFCGVMRLAAPRWSSAPQREVPGFAACPSATPAMDATTTATDSTEHVRMRDPPLSTPTDELPDLRRDALGLVPEQQVTPALDELEPGTRNAVRNHARSRYGHERIVVAAHDERLVPNGGQEAPARPSHPTEQLHRIA